MVSYLDMGLLVGCWLCGWHVHLGLLRLFRLVPRYYKVEVYASIGRG